MKLFRWFNALAVAVLGLSAQAALPGSVEFTIIPPSEPENYRLADRFKYRCAAGLLPSGGATLFVDRFTTTELTWKPEKGVFLPGDWTCYVDVIWDGVGGEPASWTPTNRVTFTIEETPDPLKPKAPYQLKISDA